MERKIILTADGSHSFHVPSLNVAYHSIHGAIQESQHVYVNAGFYKSLAQNRDEMKIFEVGLGTGLNALVTLAETEKNNKKVYYEATELYPLSEQEMRALNYCEQLSMPHLQPVFEKIHTGEWDEVLQLSKNFVFRKQKEDLLTVHSSKLFDLVYYDAFAPAAQPELWTKNAFDKVYSMLKPGGILVTYCSKGDVRRAMLASGFEVEKLQGPPRKREMLRATKPRKA